MKPRQLALIVLLFMSVISLAVGQTNYYCIVCGKALTAGRVWQHKYGLICDDCEKLPNRCSICGLPIRDGYVKTADGRFICKFDKANAVLDAASAQEIFMDTRRAVVTMYGPTFALQYPEVTVNVFDVDYWSEKGRKDDLHKFGFSVTRQDPDGKCTHTVVLLSGRLRNETVATSAHEYTHLWINENRPATHVIDGDTTEAICELTAYKLMGERNLPDLQKAILDNPYTHGKIKTLVEIEQKQGIGYIWNWVKNGSTSSLEAESSASLRKPASTFTNAAPLLPKTLKFSGLLTIGQDRQAVINGVAFETGDQKQIKLRNQTVLVRCREIQDAAVVVELNGSPARVILKKGEEKSPP